MTRSGRWARVGAMLWSLRGIAPLIAGPMVSVGLVAITFGLPRNLQIAAAGIVLLSLGLCAILVRAEWRRLAPPPGARVGGEPR